MASTDLSLPSPLSHFHLYIFISSPHSYLAMLNPASHVTLPMSWEACVSLPSVMPKIPTIQREPAHPGSWWRYLTASPFPVANQIISNGPLKCTSTFLIKERHGVVISMHRMGPVTDAKEQRSPSRKLEKHTKSLSVARASPPPAPSRITFSLCDSWELPSLGPF
jgi:hypothetical protein